jgi:hypothetical protein
LPQFVLLAVVTAVLFMVASQIITRSYFNTSLRRAVDAVESDTTLIQARSIERQLRDDINDVYEIVVDRDILDEAKKMGEAEPSDNAVLEQELYQMIKDYTTGSIVGITVRLKNDRFVFYNRLYGTWQGLPWFANTLYQIGNNQALIDLCNLTIQNMSITPGFTPYVLSTTKTYLLHMAYPLIDLYSHKEYGVVVVTFNTKILRSLVNSPELSAQKAPQAYNILTGEDGFIIAHRTPR